VVAAVPPAHDGVRAHLRFPEREAAHDAVQSHATGAIYSRNAVGRVGCLRRPHSCRFDLPKVPPDAPPDQQTVDARLCFGSGLGKLCLPSAPAMPRNLNGTLDTGIDSTCDHLVDVTGVQTCVIVGTTIAIASGGRPRRRAPPPCPRRY
jgi:hypothetical protein